jgi:hypothetical protein
MVTRRLIVLRQKIKASVPGGFDADDAAVVRDNAETLKVRPDATGLSDDTVARQPAMA